MATRLRTQIIAKLVFIVAGLVLVSCRSESSRPPLTLDQAHIEPQGFVPLGPSSRPAAKVDLNHARICREPYDKDTVELIDYHGDLFYWPVDLCHRGMEFLNGFRLTGDSTFLHRARKVVNALYSISVSEDSAWFCQYLCYYTLHGMIHITPPWYSGMAQGECTGMYTRMFEATGDSLYLRWARHEFESLLIIGPRKGPWVARIDTAGYYWIEEFPDRDRPGMTLNGFIAAVFGVFDYYKATGDERARQVYDASITTIKHYLPEFRRPGQRSYYCLGHKGAANKMYHELHTSMMYHLFRMTDDPFFEAMGDSMTADGVAVGDIKPSPDEGS